MKPADPTRISDDRPRVQMIGSLPPWKGISAYCEALFTGLADRYKRIKFTGWRSLYPTTLYPGGDPKTDEPVDEGEGIERELAWYDPVSWVRVGLDDSVDVVHAQYWSYPHAVPYAVVFSIGKLRGKRSLLTVHNVKQHEENAVSTLLNRIVYALADEFVVHSARNKSQLEEIVDVREDRIHVINHPVIGPEKDHLTETEARRQLGLDPDANVVLFFGSIREYKGLDSLIEMIDDINDEKRVELVIAGKCWEDWEKYSDLLDAHDLRDLTHAHVGFVPEADLEQYFVAADVLALPYKYFDAQSGVAGLADHFGTVSVGYDVGGLAEQVDVVASDRAEFEASLLAAVNSEIGKRDVQDDAVERHLQLYAQFASDGRPASHTSTTADDEGEETPAVRSEQARIE